MSTRYNGSQSKRYITFKRNLLKYISNNYFEASVFTVTFVALLISIVMPINFDKFNAEKLLDFYNHFADPEHINTNKMYNL